MIKLHASHLTLLAGFLLCSSTLTSQSPAVAARITSQIDESSLTGLKGNVPRLARPEFDQGAAQSSTQLTHVRLLLSRSARQQAALDKYETQLQDKSSANYHKWLTPLQFGQLYGPADADLTAIVAWLELRGLKLEQISKGRTNIAFSGTVNQVEEAFHTSIHWFNANGEQFYSNTTDPRIPSALSAVVRGVTHLNTIQPKPQFVRGPAGMMDPQTKRLVRADSTANGKAKPELTDAGSSNMLFITPGDAATIYDTPNTALNANYSAGANYTGAGVKIGIGGTTVILANTVQSYRHNFIGNSDAPIVVNVDGVTSADNAGDADEAYMDLELSGGMAPGAAIYFYTSTDLWTGIEQALNDNTVDIFSLSYGACEQNLSTSDNAYLNGLWEQAAAQGIAVTVSSGDDGSAGCDEQNTQTLAARGTAVSGFASTPYNIAVGGTDFYPMLDSYSTYASLSFGSPSTYYRTALSYIPESVWNESVAAIATVNANVPFLDGTTDIWAGSGGPSNCSNNTTVDTETVYAVGTCISGYSKPSWQRGMGVPSDGARDLPDVSFMAAGGFSGAAWLVCVDDTFQLGSKTIPGDCTMQSNGYFYFYRSGGTSASAPAFAGMLALLEQKTGGRLGQANQELYNLFNGSHASAVFHDVTVGNNSVPCVQGSANCSLNTAGYYFETGYDATPGYDLATGMGSVDVVNLLKYWGTGTGPLATSVNVAPSATTLTAGENLTVTMTVAEAGTTPTGTVTLTSGSYSSGAQALSNGSANVTIAAGSLAIGTDTLAAAYSGDFSYGSATGAATVTVSVVTNPVPVIGSLSPAFTNAGGAAFTVTINGSGFTGNSRVLWGSSALPMQYVSSSQLTAAVAAAGIASMGTTAMTVQTPTPGGGTSNSFEFEVDSPASTAAAPTIDLSTATVSAGSTAIYPVALPSTVTSASVSCLNLPSGATCRFGSNAVSIATSSTTPKGTYWITMVFTETVPGTATAWILLPILLLPLVTLRKKLAMQGIWFTACLGLVLLTAAALSTGCSGGGARTTATQVSRSSVVRLTVQ